MPELADAGTAAITSANQNAGQSSSQGSAILMQLLQSLQSKGSTVPQTQFPQPNIPQRPNIQTGTVIPQGDFQSSGENERATKEAQWQSVGRIVNKAAGIYHDRKVRTLQQDITRLVEAKHNVEQALAAGDKDGAKKNMEIVDTILADPKKHKAMAKAFGIDPMADMKKKSSPEYQALRGAYQDWFKGGKQGESPITKQFMSQLPQGQVNSPQVEQIMQLLRSPVVSAAIREQGAEDTNKTRLEVQDKKDKVQEDKISEMKDRAEKLDARVTKLTEEGLASKKEIQEMKNTAGIAKEKIKLSGVVYTADKRLDAAKVSAAWHAAGQKIAQGKVTDPKLVAAYNALTTKITQLANMKDKPGFFDFITGKSDDTKKYDDAVTKYTTEQDKLLVQINAKAGITDTTTVTPSADTKPKGPPAGLHPEVYDSIKKQLGGLETPD